MSKSKKSPEDLLRIVQETIEAAKNEIAAERLKLDIERADAADLLRQAKAKSHSLKRLEEERAMLEAELNQTRFQLNLAKGWEAERKKQQDAAKATAALKKKLERDRAQLDLEREQFEEERRQFLRDHSGSGSPGVKDEKHHAKVLELSGKVTCSDIRDAYRTAVRLWHPDKVAHMHPDLIAFAHDRMTEINNAMNYFRERYSV